MKKECTFLSKDGKTKIHTIEWQPEKEPKAVVQICHGMLEYIDRYDEFATFLTESGFVVVGHDHLGHGQSVTSEDARSHFDPLFGNEYLIGDIHKLRLLTQKKYPGKPYFMLGHSMGSFLLRQYIELYGKGLSGAAILGTATQPVSVIAAGRAMCSSIASVRGWDYRSTLIQKLSFGNVNERCKPLRTKNDWLTKDEKIVDLYNENPWTQVGFTVSAYNQMFRGIQFMQNPKNVERIPKNLPIILASGADDPIGNYGKGVVSVYAQYKECGIEDVSMRLFRTDRHEILNETDKDEVFEYLKNWFIEKLAKQ